LPVVHTNAAKTSYEEAGLGLAIVFIPGLGGTREWFRHQVSGLSTRYRTIVYDPRFSDRNADRFVPDLADELARLLDAAKAHTAVICGHSFGGFVAQEFALVHPDRASALVLISSFPTLPEETPSQLVSWMTPKGAFQTGGWFAKLISRAPRPAEPDSYEWLAQHSARLNRAWIESRLERSRSFDLTQRLGDIGAPSLVIVGARDHEQMILAARTFYEAMPDATLEVIEGGDHFCFFSRHDLVNAAIDDFLSSRLAALA